MSGVIVLAVMIPILYALAVAAGMSGRKQRQREES